MQTSILNLIDDSDKQLGFLFTKRENTHLLSLCTYFDEREYDQIQPSDITEIDEACTEGASTIAKNKRILWKALKDWAQLLGGFKPEMQKMGAMLQAINIPVSEEIAAKPRNLHLARIQAQRLFEDAEISNEDMEAITLTIKHLLLPPSDLQPIWAEIAGPHYSDWINNIDEQEVHWENVIKVSRYGLLIALCNLDTNTTAMEHFHKVVNQRQFRKSEDLIPFYLWLGFKSFTGRPIYWWVDCEYGKVKASGSSLERCRAYIFGGFIIFKTYYNGLMVQPDEIKDLTPGLDAVNDVRYISFKIKGERQPYRISNIAAKEDYDFLYSFLSNIPIQGTTEADRLVVIPDEFDDKPTSTNPAPADEPVKPPKPAESTEKSQSKSSRGSAEVDPFEELDALVGITEVKEQIRSLSNLIKVQQMRKAKGMQAVQVSLHSVFTGAPGTGKTTVARLYAGILKELGILKKGHLVEVDRTELVAGYLGQTAMKTEGIINQAMDGVLFIDEAYSLAPQDAEDSYGDEAVNVLLKRMEDDRDRFVVIVAGYGEEMHQFIDSNPGLSSRFSRYIEFPNYSAKDLVEIFTKICAKNEYHLGHGMATALEAHFEEQVTGADRKFGNARYARNLFEKLLEHQSNRVASIDNPTAADISTLEVSDLSAL
jgi:Holliday junction resolvasome RuvABC ATP-dependent DNA helicase subunit